MVGKETYGYSSLTTALIGGAIAFFLYGETLRAFLAGFVFVYAVSTFILIGLIPFFGIILYWKYGQEWLLPKLYVLLSIYPTWLTKYVFLLGLIPAFLITAYTSFLAWEFLNRR